MKRLATLTLAPLLTLSFSACSTTESDASKEEVTEGLRAIVEPTLIEQTTKDGGELDLEVFSTEVVSAYVECAVGKTYTSLSPKTRSELAKSTQGNIDSLHIAKEDAEQLQTSLETCLDTFNETRQKVFDDGRLFIDNAN